METLKESLYQFTFTRLYAWVEDQKKGLKCQTHHSGSCLLARFLSSELGGAKIWAGDCYVTYFNADGQIMERYVLPCHLINFITDFDGAGMSDDPKWVRRTHLLEFLRPYVSLENQSERLMANPEHTQDIDDIAKAIFIRAVGQLLANISVLHTDRDLTNRQRKSEIIRIYERSRAAAEIYVNSTG